MALEVPESTMPKTQSKKRKVCWSGERRGRKGTDNKAGNQGSQRSVQASRKNRKDEGKSIIKDRRAINQQQGTEKKRKIVRDEGGS